MIRPDEALLEAQKLLVRRLAMCCLDNLEGQTKAGEVLSQVQIDPTELLQFIMAGWGPMNEMCERAGMSERAIYDRSRAINFSFYKSPVIGRLRVRRI